MKRLLLVPLLCLLAAASPSQDIRPGQYRVDLHRLRSELLHQKHEMTINGATVPLSKKEWAKLVDFYTGLVASAQLDLHPDGTYLLSTPLADITGTWSRNTDNKILGTTTSSHLKIDGPITFTPPPGFTLSRTGNVFRYYTTPDDPQPLPIQLLH